GAAGFATVIFTATDDCGNTAQTTATFSIEDNFGPDFTNIPADLTIECDDPVPADEPDASDLCSDNVQIVLTENILDGNCTHEFVIEKTWTTTDDCGNESAVTQRITVQDRETPVFTNIPQDVTIECSDAVPTDAPDASDNCDPSVQMEENDTYLAGSCPQEQILIREWTATDACGNSATVSRTIIIQDRESPVFTNIPQDVTIECSDAVPTDAPVATDNCDPSVQIGENDTYLAGSCPQEQILIREWTATDACGNSATVSRTIIIQDREEPVISGVPNDLTVECDEIPPAASGVSATDNCDTSVALQFQEIIRAGICEDQYEIIRRW